MSDLMSKIGSKVRFGAPGDVKKKGAASSGGEIVDEVWPEPELSKSPPHSRSCEKGLHCWGDYALCAQRIKWSNDSHPDYPFSIRLAYYRRRCGEDHWEYASQMTVADTPARIKKLCEMTLAKKDWFGDQPLAAGTTQSK